MRRLMRDISSVLLISGTLLLLDAGLTLLWGEPLTAVIGLIRSSEVDNRYLSYQSPLLSPLVRHTLIPLRVKQRIAYLARLERRVPAGAAVGTINIPRIGAKYSVIEGTDAASLEKGPGHDPRTAFPGLGQSVLVAGHRTTYLKPFHDINDLKAGDRIVLNMPYARFTYVVQYQKIVLPTAVSVFDNRGYERLVLSACNPLYSAAQRIIIFARLQQMQPEGPALSVA